MCNHCCSGNTRSINILWVCVYSLRYPVCNVHALCFHLWPVQLYSVFSHYLINGTIFEKKNYWMWSVCFDFLCKFCPKHFSFWEELSELWSQMYIGLHVKYQLFLSDFHEICIFLTFPKSTQYKISWKSVQWEQSCSMWTDGQTDMMKLIFAFHNFLNAPKNHNGALGIWRPSSLFSLSFI